MRVHDTEPLIVKKALNQHLLTEKEGAYVIVDTGNVDAPARGNLLEVKEGSAVLLVYLK
jgi:hypothetical protein